MGQQDSFEGQQNSFEGLGGHLEALDGEKSTSPGEGNSGFRFFKLWGLGWRLGIANFKILLQNLTREQQERVGPPNSFEGQVSNTPGCCCWSNMPLYRSCCLFVLYSVLRGPSVPLQFLSIHPRLVLSFIFWTFSFVVARLFRHSTTHPGPSHDNPQPLSQALMFVLKFRVITRDSCHS